MAPWGFRSHHRKRVDSDRDKDARLENAERAVKGYRARADVAIRRLDERAARNHWRESIEKMIQGVP